MTKIFIDGSHGTTGLRIANRLAQRHDLELIHLTEENRKDLAARADAINSADVVFLCLPDPAAIEAVAMAENPNTKIIDTSTAHRVNPAWAYGMPELKGQLEVIKNSTRIANPGCHASGFIALVAPLEQEGLIDPNTALSCFSLTGYSGGGKQMIAQYEDESRSILYKAPRQYALTQQHKHLKEMQKLCGLDTSPIFCPIVADFYSGMEVSVPLFAHQLKGNMAQLKELYKTYYRSGLIHYTDEADADGMLSANAWADRDDMSITVQGNEERMILTARFDNLGKGASGAAIQNMNILLGLDQATGLNV